MSKTHSKSQQKSKTMANNSSQDSGMLNTLFLFQSFYLGVKLCDYKLSEICWLEADECWNGDKHTLQEEKDGYFLKASILLLPCVGF